MPNAIEEINCSSAEDFLRALNRGNSLWGSAMHFWAFRGHSNDDTYELIPKALRIATPPVQLGYTHAPKVGVQATNQEQINAEFEQIHEFYWSIDNQGLKIPVDNNLLRTPTGWKELKEKIENNSWPIDELHPLLAIAQHYGVPTRLLDWSDRPLVAAFFAAREAAEDPKGNFLSVWALNLDWIIHEAFPATSDKMSVYVVTAPRATNPNLHAQGGIFTTENLIKNEFSQKVSVDSVNSLVEKKWKSLNSTKPVMAHIKLPVQKANELLRLLNQEQINSATLFPGYQGVSDSLKEREFWDKPERANYWL